MLNKIVLPLIFLLLITPVCADDAPGYPGVVNKVDLPLVAETQFNQRDELKKSFRTREVEGWLSADTNWFIKGTVSHQRLRCATYNIGIQLGKGNPACLNVEWLTNVEYGTKKKQCNSVSMVHTGGGMMPELANLLTEATCVRVVTRCSGACGKTE
ncbi:MAG: hypothetical protein PVG75_13235 [Thioalkalispiraceae bacterium]|jgi:hypothetical protein